MVRIRIIEPEVKTFKIPSLGLGASAQRKLTPQPLLETKEKEKRTRPSKATPTT